MNSSSVLKIVFALLLFANGVLLFQNLSLKSELKKLLPDEIKKGDVIANFSAKDLQGNVVSSVNSNSGNYKRILFYFHPTCGYCKKQMPYWIDLVLKTKHTQYKFIALTTEDNIQAVEHYLDIYGGREWNVWIMKQEDALDAKLSGTPITVVLGSNGNVEKVWVGMWHSKEILEVERYFDIDLASVVPKNSNTIVDNFNANIDKYNKNADNFNMNLGNYNMNMNNFNANIDVK